MWPGYDGRTSQSRALSRWQGHCKEAPGSIPGLLSRATSQHSGIAGSRPQAAVQWPGGQGPPVTAGQGNPSQHVQATRKMSHLAHITPVALHLQSDHFPDSGSGKTLFDALLIWAPINLEQMNFSFVVLSLQMNPLTWLPSGLLYCQSPAPSVVFWCQLPLCIEQQWEQEWLSKQTNAWN